MSDSDKEALISGIATIPYKIEVLDDEGNVEQTFTENDIISTTYEDYRYVDEDSLCIGQFVARKLTGEILGIQPSFTIENKEIRVSMGVKVGDEITWYSLGNFLITDPKLDDVKDKTTFDSMDYTKKFNKIFDPSDLEYPTTALQLAQYCCEKCGVELATTDFVNNDFVIENNQYNGTYLSEEGTTSSDVNYTYRDVIKDIGKLAYSWVRIGWDNKCYIDFNIDSEVDEYNHITTNNYYDLSIQKESFGPVNRVIIGLKDIEGENIVVEDEASIEENGVCEIRIYNNNLTYTPELREAAINGAEKLFGLMYIPVEVSTTGHPWLLGNEVIVLESLTDGITYTTIPWDRTIEYSGHIKTKLVSKANTKTETEYRTYSNEESIINTTRYVVDKHNKTIQSLIVEQTATNERVSQVIQDINSIQNLFQITGGNNLIKDSQKLLGDEGLWDYGAASRYSLFPGSNVYPMSSVYPIEYFFGEPVYVGGYDATLIGKTVSIAKLGVSNGKMSTSATNITGLIIDTMYTLSFKITNEENTSARIKLIGNGNVVYQEIFTTPRQMEEIVFSFVANTSNYVLEIQSTSTTSGFTYIYDLMLNKGDVQTWEPSAGEIVSTTLKLSQLGFQVYSTGSDIATLMTAQGFDIRRFQNGTLYEIVTTFNKEGFQSKKGILDELQVGNFEYKTVNYQGYETLVLYKKESDS